MSALATDLARRLDPVQLAQAIGLEPDPWQVDVLRSGSSRVLLNCCRQSGKTTVLAIIALHQALYRRNSLALVVSASERQARELLRVVISVYRALGKPVDSEAESGLALTLENGSRVIVVPSTSGTIRGYANVGTLIVDEAARVSDETFVSVLPMLGVSNGRLLAASTPFGAAGWWYECWRGDEDWERITIRASQCPRLSASFLDKARGAMGSWFYMQEYEATFMDPSSAAFRSTDIEAAFDQEVIAWSL